MIKKIGIMGAHGTGKTTLANNLADEFDQFTYVKVLDEAARLCPFPVNEEMTLQSQKWLVARQIAGEHLADVADVVICDRTVLDPVVYAYWKAFQSSGDDRSKWFAWLSVVQPFAFNWMDTYDELYWCRPNGSAPVDDGFRALDPAFQLKIDCLFSLMIRSSGLIVRTVSDQGKAKGARGNNNIKLEDKNDG